MHTLCERHLGGPPEFATSTFDNTTCMTFENDIWGGSRICYAPFVIKLHAYMLKAIFGGEGEFATPAFDDSTCINFENEIARPPPPEFEPPTFEESTCIYFENDVWGGTPEFATPTVITYMHKLV